MKKFRIRQLIMLFVLLIGFGSVPATAYGAAAPKLNKTSVTLTVGKTTQLKVKNTKKKVKWSTTKKSVCTVTNKGLVKAKKKGTAYVKAKVGTKTLKCKVTVKAATKTVKSIKIVGDSNVLAPGGSMQLSVKYTPSAATGKYVNWSTSNSYYATVENGVVKALRNGNVTIKATLQSNEAVYATYNIQIKDIEATVDELSSGDGGDLLLTSNGATEIMKFSLSDTVANVTVNVLDSIGNVVRSYNMGTLSANTSNVCTWDLLNSAGVKVSAGSYCFEIVAAGSSTKSDYFTIYASSDFAGGNGSAANPYQIANLEQLCKVGSHNGVYYIQTANIDLNYQDFSALFTSDVPFNGNYNGNGCSISNIMGTSEADYRGIFSKIGEKGSVSNLIVTGGTYQGKSFIGMIAGSNEGTIENCTVTSCNITASGIKAGTICGFNGGVIKNCRVSQNIINAQGRDGWDSHAGGICGYNSGVITGCILNKDTLKSGYRCSGGVCGYNLGNILNCAVTGDNITAGDDGYVGGISGYSKGIVANCTVEDCEISGAHYKGGIIGGNGGTNTNNTYNGTLPQVGSW